MVMCVIDTTTVRWSEAQLQPRQPRTEMTTPSTSSAPSTSAPSSSSGGVMLKVVMAQLNHMDACLDTLTTKLYQVNTCVSRITQRQARMGGFAASPSPSPSLEASEDEDADDGSSDDDDDEDEDASFSSDEEVMTSQ